MKFLSAVLILLLSSTSFAEQFKFEAKVDRNKIYEGDSLSLYLVISAESSSIDAGDIQLPKLEGFEVMSSSESFGSRSAYINGQFKFLTEKTYRLVLMPQKKGELTIDKASIEVKGQKIETQPIKISVLDASKAPNPKRGRQAQPQEDEDDNFPMDEMDKEAQEMFSNMLRRRGFSVDGRGGVRSQPSADNREAFLIGVEADKKRVYVGEQIIASWYLYTKGGIQQYEAVKYPDLKGFLKEDLEMATRLNFEDTVVNGVPYKRALLIRYALYPLGTGQKKIDPYKAKATVIDLSGGMGVFGIGRPAYYQKASQELPIEVVPLPTEGRPESFSGAVGQFNITGSLGASQVKANQPVSLKIKFSGRGNVRAIEAPPLNLPAGLEVFDTKKDSQMSKTGEGAQEFEVLIVPRTPGKVTIPGIEVSYFDPSQKKYVKTRTPEFPLTVLQGDGTGGVSVPLAHDESAAAAQKADFKYIKTSAPSLPVNKIVDVLLVFLYLVSLGYFGREFWLIYTGDKRALSNSVRKRIQTKLKAAQVALKNKDYKAVGIEFTNALVGVLGELSGLGGASMQLDELLARLTKLPNEEKDQIRKFMHECELLSFAPEELLQSKDREQSARQLLKTAEILLSRLLMAAKRAESGAQGASDATNRATS